MKLLASKKETLSVKTQTTLISVRVRPELSVRLEKLAASVDRSKSYLAAEAIEDYLDLHEWQIQAIEKGIAAVDQGDTISFESIKAAWENKREDSLR